MNGMVKGIIVPNSAGLVNVTAAAAGDLVHTLSAGSSAKINKIMYSNNTGATVTLIFGMRTNAAAFVALFPTITCVNGQHDGWPETMIPDIIYRVDTTAAPAGSDGNIYVLSSAAGVLVRISVEEIRS